MPCDTRLKPRQTIQERAKEVRDATQRLASALAAGRVKVKVGPQGAITFENWSTNERDGVTDACAYRRIMATGSAMARLAIARAEQMAGRTVDRQVVGHGAHSHDGGATGHSHKG
jgi:hypothetical protein